MVRRIARVRARPLRDSLAALARAGSRLPLVTVLGYRVSYNAATRRLYVGQGKRFLGEILPSGVFRLSEHCKPTDVKVVRAIIENTVHLIRGEARLGNITKCAVCSRPLDAEDLKVGIGRGCWENGLFGTYERRAIAGERRSVKLDTPRNRKQSKRRQRNG